MNYGSVMIQSFPSNTLIIPFELFRRVLSLLHVFNRAIINILFRIFIHPTHSDVAIQVPRLPDAHSHNPG
jgi:hypothetical protein